MQAVQPALTIRPYQRRDRTNVRNLAYYNAHVHTHLDWQTVDEYLLDPPKQLWVAYRGQTLLGAMGVSDILTGTCWLRVMLASDRHNPNRVLQALWGQTTDELREQGVHTVALLLLRDWMEDFVAQNNFAYQEDIVTLRRHGRTLPERRPAAPPDITYAEAADLDTITKIDHAAFDPPWQMSRAEIYQGLRISAYSTLALHNNHPVGYQITTAHGMNGHLARLAVHPHAQRNGIGGTLLHDMLGWFHRRDILSMTVNTQNSNVKSQRLYKRYDFQRNGYDLPVWAHTLS